MRCISCTDVRDMLVTLEVSQAPISWLKFVTPSNSLYMLVTSRTSHLSIAPENLSTTVPGLGSPLQLSPVQVQFPLGSSATQAASARLKLRLTSYAHTVGGPSLLEDEGLRVYSALHALAP